MSYPIRYLLLSMLAWSAHAAEWTTQVSPRGQVFPALLLAIANIPLPEQTKPTQIGDPGGVIGVRVRAERDQQPVRVTIQLPGLLHDSTLEARLPKAGEWYLLYPILEWDYARLRETDQAGPATMVFELQLDQGPVERKVERVRIRSVNDAPYFVRDGNRTVNLAWIFAAYVDEDHPRVLQILGDALDTGTVDRFDGYQSGDPKQVMRQVFAIWRALRSRGIRYSSIAPTGNATSEVLSQHVRFIDETWRSAEANCVDGTVLLAAVLRKIDLNPSLVLVPGHMFLAFELSPGGERSFLETTLIGEGLPANRQESEAAAFANFRRASERGHAQFQKARNHFGDPAAPEYQIIDIAAARAIGVAPIGARR